uniref:COR domain-containing protein n=1 Tax=Magallana gigas TaxID=29159 RepID=A0A8W8P0E9_MAGGI
MEMLSKWIWSKKQRKLENPACLEIDREFRCFAADNGCKKRGFHTTESHGWPATGYIIATAAILAVIILSWIIFQKRKREQVEKCKDSNENESLLKDNPEIDDDKLRQFLSKGEITVCHIRFIIVGCGKAGKTTLFKRLQNVSFDELMQIERTEMVDFHVNSFEVLLEEDTIKSVEKEDTLPTVLFSKDQLEMPLKENDGKMAKETHQPGIRKRNVSEKSSLKNTTLGQIENIPMVILKNQANNDNAENEETLIFEPHSQDTTLVQNQFSPEPNEKHGEDIDANVDKIDFEKFAISKIKDAVNELLNEKELRPRITFLDFAGQSMYYAFHQIFLRPKSCSILVVDMTKSLYDKVGDQDKNEKECSRFASWRYKDYFKFWLESIDSFSDTVSPVIIVGTHADKLSKEECRKFLKNLNELFDIWSHSGLRRHLNRDRMYTIGFPDSGSELEDLKDLKKCIANIVNCPRYSRENIRPVWALFELILNKMKETEKVIPRKTLSDYSDQLSAQEFRIDESEISKMLVFFHRVGVLLYFDKDGLKENIILDIQWLLDAFKCIIEYPVRTEENDIKRRHFCRTGELDNAELDRIWHIQGKDFLKHKTTIIAYMQQLGLLMPLENLHSVDSIVYYFPSTVLLS